MALVLDEKMDRRARGVALRRINMSLQRACPDRDFDVRCLEELPAAVAGRVVTEGVRLCDNDPGRRVAAQVRARMLYHDFLPFEKLGTSEGLAGLRERVGGG